MNPMAGSRVQQSWQDRRGASRRGGVKPRGRHLSRERHPGARLWQHERGPVPEAGRWRGVPTNPRRGGREAGVVRHSSEIGQGRAEASKGRQRSWRLRLARVTGQHGDDGKSFTDERRERPTTRTHGSAGNHDRPFSNRHSGLPVRAPGVSHGPRRSIDPTEVARNVAQRASTTTGNLRCSSKL